MCIAYVHLLVHSHVRANGTLYIMHNSRFSSMQDSLHVNRHNHIVYRAAIIYKQLMLFVGLYFYLCLFAFHTFCFRATFCLLFSNWDKNEKNESAEEKSSFSNGVEKKKTESEKKHQ